MALKLDVLANTRQFVQEMKKAGASSEDVTDALDELARQGDKDLEKVEDSLKEVARAAKTSGDKVGRGLKDGFDEAKDEAKSSGKEAAASFDGSFESVADFVQETLANAFEGFGPIGAAAGIAIAATLGAVMASAVEAQEKLQEAREAAGELAQELYDNGGTLPMQTAVSNLFESLTKETKANGPVQQLLDQFLDFGSRVDSIKTAAKQAKVPLQDMVKAISGNDIGASKEALKKVNDELKKMESNPTTAWVWETAPLKDMQSALEVTIEKARVADESLGLVGKGFPNAEAYIAKIDEIGGAWEDAATDASDYFVEAEDGTTSFDWNSYLTNAEATLTAANDYKRKIVSLPPDIRDEAERVFSEQGAVAANQYVDAFVGASNSDKQRFVNAAANNGTAAGEAAGKAIIDGTKRTANGLVLDPIKVPIMIDDTALHTYRPPVIKIPGSIVLPSGKQALL